MNEEVLRQIPLFESLCKDARAFIANRLKTETFCAGEMIVRQGDTGSSLYIIKSGLVQVTKREKNGTFRELARFQIGDYFGEMSLLAGQPRSADITALTDTTTLVLCKDDMDAILQEYPSIAVHFSKVLSKRLRDASHLQLAPKRLVSVVSMMASHLEPMAQTTLAVNLAASFLRELMKQVLLIDISSHSENLMTALQIPHDTSVLNRGEYERFAYDSDFSPLLIKHKTGIHMLSLSIGTEAQPHALDKTLQPLLERLKQQYEYILINCSETRTSLHQTALEQSDLILYLTPTSDNAIQHGRKEVELLTREYGTTTQVLIGVVNEDKQRVPERLLEETLAPYSFVCIHQDRYLVEQFLRTGRPFIYEHPQNPFSRSLQRITRKIGGVRVGLALGSGAARGFAHAGVLKVLDKYGIPIDMIAGSSMGALVGGFYAAGVSASELEDMVLSYRSKRKVRRTIFDMTIPLHGLSKGNRLVKFMRSHLGDMTFDDVQIPFVAVATDIRNGHEVFLRHGLLWQALRASGSVPVLFEPFYLDGSYLIDGGITNPLPTDILIEKGMDIIISCAVNSIQSSVKPEEQSSLKPAEKKSYGIFDALTRSMGMMSAANTMQKARLADVDIRPDVSYIDWVDFHRGDELLREGEAAAEAAIPAILELIHGKV